ncbi:MAG: TRAP transporter small permease [Rhodospirillaceae bacterium]|nr:TRAP transporter small permease [Rhodospirillaceae bacterium]MBT6140184.1 TRAP transporter small permease [Rhodospirillaceae bacterium]
MFEAVQSKLSQISHVAVWVGGGALLLSAIMVTGDVLARKIFGVTISGSDEISGYVFAASTTWAYSYTLLGRANIRIDALYNMLKAGPRAFLDVIGIFLLLYYVYLLTTNGIGVFIETLEFDKTAQTTLATPLWIPQMFWISGLAFFLLCTAFVSVYALTGLVRGDWRLVNRVAGVKSVEEEISEETHA